MLRRVIRRGGKQNDEGLMGKVLSDSEFSTFVRISLIMCRKTEQDSEGWMRREGRSSCGIHIINYVVTSTSSSSSW